MHLSQESKWYANCPISTPVVNVDEELANMGGFVMTERGIRIGMFLDAPPDWYLERLIPDRIQVGYGNQP